MKVVAFGGWAVLAEHMSTTAFFIVRKSAADMHSAKPPSRRMNILYWKNRDTKSQDKNFPFTFGFKA